MSKVPKVITAEDAAKLVNSGSTIGIITFGMLLYPDDLTIALENRFLETGEPRDLTLWNALGGARGKHMGTERFGHDGFCKKVILSYWLTSPNLIKMALEEKFEAYNLPLGIMSHLTRASAGKKPGIITPIGLKTFCDPRYGGGKLNSSAKDNWSEVMVIDGKEYLFFRTPKIDVCFIRGTTADPLGNITSEKEAAILDILAYAQATKANGGTVICQVERLSDIKANPHAVKVPRFMVDYIVVAPNQQVNRIEVYNPSYTGEILLPKEYVHKHNEKLVELSVGANATRNMEDWIIARRAAQELKPDVVINLGVGMPDLVGTVAQQEGIADSLLFTVETGPIGGVPGASVAFGESMNPEAIMEQAHLFDAYDGGVLDLAFVGAAEIDPNGSVNISKFGKLIAGIGGFAHITQNSKQVVFLTTFTGGKELDIAFEDGQLKIKQEGSSVKFKSTINQINFSGEYAREIGKHAIYVTERCVFQQRPEGFTLIEIAPGIDLEKDIFAHMQFRPLVAEDLKIMDVELFTGESLDLKAKWNQTAEA